MIGRTSGGDSGQQQGGVLHLHTDGSGPGGDGEDSSPNMSAHQVSVCVCVCVCVHVCEKMHVCVSGATRWGAAFCLQKAEAKMTN